MQGQERDQEELLQGRGRRLHQSNFKELTVAVKKERRKKIKKIVPKATVTINSTFNNTIVTFAETNGAVLCWASGGSAGFKGTKKSTPYAAQRAANLAAHKAIKMGVREVDIRVKGPGPGREAAVRALQVAGLIIKTITDVSPIPHNGCRPPAKRSV
jgi:small subunit ribosomal protein S11